MKHAAPRPLRLIVIVLLALFFPLSAVAAELPAPQAIEFTEETLDNGLRVLYAPLHQAPVVHVRVLYHVGSRDERPDRQGFAHMFEHMMFRGSAHVAPEEHMKRINTVGGSSNAYTSFDETVYVNTIPSQYLDMALWLEADRMASFKVSEDIYKTERKVVAEEWRMYMNQPYGNAYELFLEAAYTMHSYRWTPIGDMDHLKAARVEELQSFFNTHYVPNNAVLVIAGDFEQQQASKLARDYFAWIPAGATPSRDIPTEPEQTEAREKSVSEAVPLPMVMIGYHIPAYMSDDHTALAALNAILGGGESSRLQRLLVTGEQPMCVGVQAIHAQSDDPGMFGVGGVALAGKSIDDVRKKLIDAVANVAANGVTQEELVKAQTNLLTGIINGRETAVELAAQLGDEELMSGRAERVNEAPEKITALTIDDIHRVAGTYLKPERSTTLVIKPSIMAAVASQAEARKAEQLKEAPVAPSTAPVEARAIEFPPGFPTTAPSAQPRDNPEFAKGEKSAVNGVTVIVMPDHRLPLVHWTLAIRRGSYSEPKGKEGTANLAAAMLRRGVDGMTYEELSKDLDGRAISLSAGDWADHTRLSGSCTSDQLDHAIERSRQILRTPTFPSDEFARLKEQTINSLNMARQSPTTVADNDLRAALFGDTPIGRFATPESVASIELADVRTFYESVYRSNSAIFILSGDVTVARGRELAEKLLGDWPADDLPAATIDLPPPPPTRRIILVDRPDAKQATVRMGIRAYALSSDDKFPGTLASQILSSGIESRLGKYVRATKGLAYGVRGVFAPDRQTGAFRVSTETNIESTADAIDAIFHVLDGMRAAPVTDTELAEAKMRVAGGMVMGMQTIHQQAGYRVDGILNEYPIDYYDRYPERIGAVSADKIRQVMNTYVLDDRMTIIVVAPAEKVRKSLEKFGEVEVRPMPAQRANSPATQPTSSISRESGSLPVRREKRTELATARERAGVRVLLKFQI